MQRLFNILAICVALVLAACGGGARKPDEQDTAFSDLLSGIVTASTNKSQYDISNLRRMFDANSPYFGANFLCHQWDGSTELYAASGSISDPSGITVVKPGTALLNDAFPPSLNGGASQDVYTKITNTEASDSMAGRMVFAPAFDATDCSSSLFARAKPIFCETGFEDIYPMSLRFAGQSIANWYTRIPSGFKLGDVEDIAHQPTTADSTFRYVFLLSAGKDNSDPNTGAELQPQYVRVRVPDSAAGVFSNTAANPATADCGGKIAFPEGEEDDFHDILASAFDPATGNWYMLDSKVDPSSSQYAEPVLYYLTAADVNDCTSTDRTKTLNRLATLPVAHWLLLYVITSEDVDKRKLWMSEILEFIAPTNPETGNIVGNSALRTKIESFFNMKRSTVEAADIAAEVSESVLSQLFDNNGKDVPGILKSLFITGMSINHDGTKIALSTFGGEIAGWEIGLRLKFNMIPPTSTFMQQYIHSPIVASDDFKAGDAESGGLAYVLDGPWDPVNNVPEQLIFQRERNNDRTQGVFDGFGESVDAKTYMFSCKDTF